MVEDLKIPNNHDGFVFVYSAHTHKMDMRKPHRHKELEMNIVTKGYAEYVLADQRYALIPGSIVWLFPGQEHMLTKTDSNFEMCVVVFKQKLLKNISDLYKKYSVLAEKNPAGFFCRRISLASAQILENVCKSLSQHTLEKNIKTPAYHFAGQAFGFKCNTEYMHGDPVMLNAGLSFLMTTGWHLFSTEGIEDRKQVLTPAIEKAVSLLKTLSEHNLNLVTLSRECGLSPSRLSRLFNEQMGLSIADYRNKLKLERFIDCTRNNPGYNISEVCFHAGFGSYSQFYKLFKKSFGISPKVYFT